MGKIAEIALVSLENGGDGANLHKSGMSHRNAIPGCKRGGQVANTVPRRVLVIEDDADYRLLLERFMNKAFPDAEVYQYDPGEKGRPGDDFDWSRFDVLLLDYRLGADENGLDWLRQFKKKNGKFPATILLTAAGSEEVAVRALRFGAHDYLKKQNLSAKRLAESVADAFNVRAQEEDSSLSLTINASRFSKSYFYGQFDLAFDEVAKGEQRAVVLIRTDEYTTLQASMGVLAMDELARQLANAGIEHFGSKRYHPRATRFTDSSIALLVGGYKDKDELKSQLASLCEQVTASPPVLGDRAVPVTVSIGAAPITSRDPGVHGLLQQAEAAAGEAAETEGNSFAVASSDTSRRRKAQSETRGDLFDAKSAMRENRIQAMFRPITAVSEDSASLPFSEFFEIAPRFITRSGESIPVDPVLEQHADSGLTRVVDRWKIRECIGRLLAGESVSVDLPGFLIRLDEPSYKDVNLARWIGEIIKYYGEPRRFGEIYLAIKPDVLMRNTKPVTTLLGHLESQHGFGIALDGVGEGALCKVCFSNFAFGMVILSDEIVQRVIKRGPEGTDLEKIVKVKNDALILARGVEDANGLHGVISAGIDLVQGDFVAPEQEELASMAAIETVQIGE